MNEDDIDFEAAAETAESAVERWKLTNKLLRRKAVPEEDESDANDEETEKNKEPPKESNACPESTVRRETLKLVEKTDCPTTKSAIGTRLFVVVIVVVIAACFFQAFWVGDPINSTKLIKKICVVFLWYFQLVKHFYHEPPVWKTG